MNPFRSIRWRLQLWYGLIFAVVLAGLGAVAYIYEADTRLARIDDDLQRLVVMASARVTPAPSPDRRGPRTGPPAPYSLDAVNNAFSAKERAAGYYYAIFLRNGPQKFQASPDAPPEIPPPDGPGEGVRQRGLFREAYLTLRPGDHLIVGRSIEADRIEQHRVGWLLAGGGLGLYVLTFVIGWWLIGRSLRPIRDISEAAASIARGDMARRIDTRDTDSELGQLAQTLNSTFGRLEAAFAQQARFTADAAHELRTPVTVMLTHVQNGLGMEETTGEQREAFEACQRAAQRMRRLIEALLQLARLDAGQTAGARARIDLAEIAGDCLDLVRPLAETRKIVIRDNLAPAACVGSAELLTQVVTNLVTNAIQYHREGGEIRVSTAAGSGQVVLTVADNGPGIDPVHLPHIFERFYRADKARTSAGSRTGLGLAITRAAVEAHGGTITVESTVGEGSVFVVTLPAA